MVAFSGDGAMQMNGLAELITIKRYWQEWSDPRLVIAVLHNNDLNQVTWEMRSMQGSPKFTDSQTLPEVDYAAFARSVGLSAVTIRDGDDLGMAWDSALAADRPMLLDVYCDPDVPPIPPHASWDEIQKLAKSLWRGDEDRWGVLKEGVKTKLQELRH
ncbi:thiamine pyrophosphate-dependent enzyme [Kribbella turkmenica]|uniref:thiamine pyrophosphate-dependent enzyme n=1 Tax=Kribbella turkmenica TaxID=2530375 RepID=UPI001F200D19|nr:thiamine pyrophosphate-dependent enzyme [Kribbella turkmenica]